MHSDFSLNSIAYAPNLHNMLGRRVVTAFFDNSTNKKCSAFSEENGHILQMTHTIHYLDDISAGIPFTFSQPITPELVEK